MLWPPQPLLQQVARSMHTQALCESLPHPGPEWTLQPQEVLSQGREVSQQRALRGLLRGRSTRQVSLSGIWGSPKSPPLGHTDFLKPWEGVGIILTNQHLLL